MRAPALVLTTTALLLFAAPDAVAGGWSLEDYLKEKNHSDWDGYGVGTMTHRRMRQIVTMPQYPAPQTLESEEKKTLKEITDTEYVIQVETLEGGEWITTEEREPKDEGLVPEVEDKGTETVSVGGEEYPCAKKKVTWKKGDEVDEIVVVWEHAEAGIVKMKVRAEREFTMVATDLDASWKVGEVTLAGRAFQMETTSQGMLLKGETRMSLDVPGNLVRNELKGSQGPVKVEIVMELVAFTRK